MAAMAFPIKLFDDNHNGNFINQGDYDSNTKILYTSRSNTAVYRVKNVTTTRDVDSIKIGLGSKATALRVSPYGGVSSSNLYVGTTGGRVFKVVHAEAASPTITEITGPFPTGSVSCIAFGATESQLLVTFYNYGVISVWESRNGGGSWTPRESNLPNMPVRWAEYHPQNPDQVFLATELGVWSTDNINVSSPVWNSTNGGLANVRTDMLRIRKSDGTIMASTHGRGVFTATIPSNLSQTIAFNTALTKTFGDPAFDLDATSTSTLPVVYSSADPSIASITGATVTIKSGGSVVITASQPGNTYYSAAVPVSKTMVINKAVQTISFIAISDKTLGGPSFSLAATASSGLGVSFATTNSDKVSISGIQVSIVKAGRVTITASQAGNASFNQVSQNQAFCINPVIPTVSISDKRTEAPTLTSSALSGNQWYLNGTAIDGSVNTNLTVLGPGVYQVQVKVDGCVSDFSEKFPIIVVGDLPVSAKVALYPNPVVSYFEVVGLTDEVIDSELFDAAGRTSSLSLEKTGNTYRGSVQHLPQGIYFLKLYEGVRVHQIKFIKD